MAHSEIVIREGNLNDRDAFARLQATNLAGQDDPDLLRLYYHDMLRRKGFVSVCAAHAGQVVGFACGVNRESEAIAPLSRYPLEVGRIILRRPSLIGRMLVRVLHSLRARFVAMDRELPAYECGPVVVENRYRNMRVGSLLMRALHEAMEARHIPAAFLKVSSGNEAARRLYERCGYIPVRREGGSIVMVIQLRQ